MMQKARERKIRFWNADPTHRFLKPETNDVLVGRAGKVAFEHEGNHRLRILIAENVDYFVQAETRFEKTKIVRSLMREILDRGGRFLKKDADSTHWHLAGFKDARDKISHALRDAGADKVKCMVAMKEKYDSRPLSQTKRNASSFPMVKIQRISPDGISLVDPPNPPAAAPINALQSYYDHPTAAQFLLQLRSAPSYPQPVSKYMPAENQGSTYSVVSNDETIAVERKGSCDSESLDFYNDINLDDLLTLIPEEQTPVLDVDGLLLQAIQLGRTKP